MNHDAFGGGAIVNGEAGADTCGAKGALNHEGGIGLFGAAFNVDAFPGGGWVFGDIRFETAGLESSGESARGDVGGFAGGGFDIDAEIASEVGDLPEIRGSGGRFDRGAATGFEFAAGFGELFTNARLLRLILLDHSLNFCRFTAL